MDLKETCFDVLFQFFKLSFDVLGPCSLFSLKQKILNKTSKQKSAMDCKILLMFSSRAGMTSKFTSRLVEDITSLD